MKPTIIWAGLITAIVGAPAYAQGPYVSASFMGDIVRLSSRSDISFRIGNGDVPGFAVRLGTPVWSKLGVEAELGRSSGITSDGVPEALITLSRSVERFFVNPDGSVTIISPNRTETLTHRTTLSMLAWVRQPLTARVSLSFLGGPALVRTTKDSELGFRVAVGPPGPTPPSPLRLETADYVVRPLVGAEARVSLTARLELVPSVRLLSLEDGWLVRPAVGVGWVF
jgi:hypothetical protein